MNKFHFLLILILLLAGCTSESMRENEILPEETPDYTVPIEAAEKDLLSLLADLDAQAHPTRSGGGRRIASKFSLGTPVATRSAEEEQEPYVHIFNFENEEGFAIMSGDERVPSLLALTFDGSLYPETEIDNPGLALFLSNLDAYYEECVSTFGFIGGISDDDPMMMDQSGVGYGPLVNFYTAPTMGYCQVLWDQDPPYNAYCPEKEGKKTLVGCVPVAVGQLMAMHLHPSSYNEHTFNWLEILNATPTGLDQTARLLQQLGLSQNLDVSYGLEASGAKPENIKRTLNNFGYACNGLNNYDSTEIIRELTAGYPCLVGGQSIRKKHKFLGITFSTTYHEGHRWLLHGLLTRKKLRTEYAFDGSVISSYYETNSHYVLCNWGWGSSPRNGYYLSGVFDTNHKPDITRGEEVETSGEEYNFQYQLSMIIGIRKK